MELVDKFPQIKFVLFKKKKEKDRIRKEATLLLLLQLIKWGEYLNPNAWR